MGRGSRPPTCRIASYRSSRCWRGKPSPRRLMRRDAQRGLQEIPRGTFWFTAPGDPTTVRRSRPASAHPLERSSRSSTSCSSRAGWRRSRPAGGRRRQAALPAKPVINVRARGGQLDDKVNQEALLFAGDWREASPTFPRREGRVFALIGDRGPEQPRAAVTGPRNRACRLIRPRAGRHVIVLIVDDYAGARCRPRQDLRGRPRGSQAHGSSSWSCHQTRRRSSTRSGAARPADHLAVDPLRTFAAAVPPLARRGRTDRPDRASSWGCNSLGAPQPFGRLLQPAVRDPRRAAAADRPRSPARPNGPDPSTGVRPGYRRYDQARHQLVDDTGRYGLHLPLPELGSHLVRIEVRYGAPDNPVAEALTGTVTRTTDPIPTPRDPVQSTR